MINNRFENIEEQAIYAGASNSTTGTNHVSMNNKFYNVGNLGGGRESTTCTAVITFVTDGNVTVNDWFDRQEFRTQSMVPEDYPLRRGFAAGLPADAAGPDHHGRTARGGGLQLPAGGQHRPPGLDHHHPRRQPARGARPAGLQGQHPPR